MKMKRLGLLLLVLCLTSSCMKKLSESDNDGTVASADEVTDKILEAWGDDDPAEIEKNEFVAFDQEQKIQDGTPTLVRQEGITVKDRVETVTDITFTFLQQIREINGEESKSSTTESTAKISKSRAFLGVDELSARAFKNGQVHQRALSQAMMLGAASICIPAEDWDVTCYNLATHDEVRPAPEAVRAQANCGGIPKCEIRVRKVSFDLVVTTKEANNTTTKQKLQYSFAMSPDVPYMSRMMDYCYRGLIMVPAAGQKILVGVCSLVKNFKTDP